METIIVGPAYGRDYKTKAEALKAWNDNRDFVCYGKYKGMATSQADCFNLKCNVEIRYANLEKAIFIPADELKDVNGVIPEWDTETFGSQDDEGDLAGVDEDDLAAVMKHLEGK